MTVETVKPEPSASHQFTFTSRLKLSPRAQLLIEIGLVGIILIAATALRLYHLSNKSLWSDEIEGVTFGYSESSFWNALTLYRPNDIHPPLFFGVAYLWLHAFGFSEFAVRFFSVLAALATLALTYYLTRRWFDRKIALVSLVLLAVSPLHLFWSQSIRPYALLTLLVVGAMGWVWYITEKPQQIWRWVVWGLSATLLMYTHYPSLHLIFAQVVFFGVLYYRNWRALIGLGIGLVTFGLSFLPWLGHFLEQSKLDFSDGSYLNGGFSQLLEIASTLSSWFVPNGLVTLSGAVFIPLFIVGLVSLWNSSWRKIGLLLAVWCLLPPLTIWVSSFIKPNLAMKQLIVCVPPYLIITAVGIVSLYRYWRPLPAIALVLAIALGLMAFRNLDKNYTYQDWRGLVNYVVANRQPGDLVIIGNPYGYNQSSFDYYYRFILGESGNLDRKAIYPESLAVYPTPAQSQKIKDQIENLFKDRQRVWVVASYDGQANWIKQNLLPNIPNNFEYKSYKDYKTTEQNTIGVFLYARKPNS